MNPLKVPLLPLTIYFLLNIERYDTVLDTILMCLLCLLEPPDGHSDSARFCWKIILVNREFFFFTVSRFIVSIRSCCNVDDVLQSTVTTCCLMNG